MKPRTLIPNDFRDFLSLISIFGFIAIFFQYTLNNPFLSDKLIPMFLIIGGSGLMIAGKVFQIKKWTSDGLQKHEISQVLSIIFGLSSIIIGLMIWLGIGIPSNLTGFVGMLALAPAIFILLDYIAKNT